MTSQVMAQQQQQQQQREWGPKEETREKLRQFLISLSTRDASGQAGTIQWNQWAWRGLQNELAQWGISDVESDANRGMIVELVDTVMLGESCELLNSAAETGVAAQRDATVAVVVADGELDAGIDEEDDDSATTIYSASIRETNDEEERAPDVTPSTMTTSRIEAADSNPPEYNSIVHDSSIRRSHPSSTYQTPATHPTAPSYWLTSTRDVGSRDGVESRASSSGSTLVHVVQEKTRYRKAFVAVCMTLQLFLPLDVDENKTMGPFQRHMRRRGRVIGS